MNTFLTIFVFALIFIVVMYYSKKSIERDQKDKKEREEIEENRKKNLRDLWSSILKIVETDFKWDVCSRCNDQSVSFLKFNSVGTSVYVECKTCEKKTWYKAKGGFEKGQEIVDMWEETKNLTDLIGNEGETDNYYMTSEVEDELNKDHRKSIPQTVKDQVWNRDGGKCVECGSDKKIEFDHIIPYSKGGSNTYRNLQLLCENCNRKKSDKIG
ncbi:MAG: HNH endonuclease [Candidatus Marinimicrobia bacterium]|nr:HNH endonuclease [Candidatus Neomarinimicrobiota bacterium]